MKEVLLVTIGFSPNVGGIETHFDDLTKALDEKGWKTWVLTYKPITTDVKADFIEKRGKNISIYRIPWLNGLFYKLVQKPLFEFLFLAPPLFVALPFFLVVKGKNITTIHSHGLIAGFVSVIWGTIFSKKVITTTHSIYNFPESSYYRKLARWIFSSSEVVLTLSKQSKEEIQNLGINKDKIKVFTYWINLDTFQRVANAKNIISLKGFNVLFVGRLVEEKGVLVLLKSFVNWPKEITLIIIGAGPLEPQILKESKKHKNLIFLGRIDNNNLPKYYSASDLLIIPSVHEEGFGRVILESLACGTPVIGANRGAIPEAMNNDIGRIIDITVDNITKWVEFYFKNRNKLEVLSKNARDFALNRYSEKNAETIIENY